MNRGVVRGNLDHVGSGRPARPKNQGDENPSQRARDGHHDCDPFKVMASVKARTIGSAGKGRRWGAGERTQAGGTPNRDPTSALEQLAAQRLRRKCRGTSIGRQ